MTAYQTLMEESDNACTKAIAFFHKKDWKNFYYWRSRSANLKKIALNLPWT